MRAIGYKIPHAIDDVNGLSDLELPTPVPTGRDLLVEIRAVSVNPVDTKIRASTPPEPGQWRVLGWDAAGTVTAVGPDVQDFAVGDAVFYAGALQRSGTNAEFHLVDERLVGRKPETLDWAQAAALPLTALTAWEMLFDRLDITRGAGNARDAAHHWRGRRCRVHRHPACTRADGDDRYRNRFAS